MIELRDDILSRSTDEGIFKSTEENSIQLLNVMLLKMLERKKHEENEGILQETLNILTDIYLGTCVNYYSILIHMHEDRIAGWQADTLWYEKVW